MEFLRSQSLYLCRGDLFQDRFEGSFTPSVKAAIEEAYVAHRIDFTYEKFKKELRESVYINCWSLGIDDNMALWALYGKSEASVAITTTVAKLKSELAQPGPAGLRLRKVSYIKHWRNPKIHFIPYSNIFEFKVVAYEFEREVRIILDKLEHNFRQSDKERGVLMKVVPNRLLRSVVVSPLASKWFVDLVKDLTHKYGVTVPVNMSKLASEPI